MVAAPHGGLELFKSPRRHIQATDGFRDPLNGLSFVAWLTCQRPLVEDAPGGVMSWIVGSRT